MNGNAEHFKKTLRDQGFDTLLLWTPDRKESLGQWTGTPALLCKKVDEAIASLRNSFRAEAWFGEVLGRKGTRKQTEAPLVVLIDPFDDDDRRDKGSPPPSPVPFKAPEPVVITKDAPVDIDKEREYGRLQAENEHLRQRIAEFEDAEPMGEPYPEQPATIWTPDFVREMVGLAVSAFRKPSPPSMGRPASNGSEQPVAPVVLSKEDAEALDLVRAWREQHPDQYDHVLSHLREQVRHDDGATEND